MTKIVDTPRAVPPAETPNAPIAEAKVEIGGNEQCRLEFHALKLALQREESRPDADRFKNFSLGAQARSTADKDCVRVLEVDDSARPESSVSYSKSCVDAARKFLAASATEAEKFENSLANPRSDQNSQAYRQSAADLLAATKELDSKCILPELLPKPSPKALPPRVRPYEDPSEPACPPDSARMQSAAVENEIKKS